MILEFKNVTGKTKHFNLQNVSFTLEPGYIMGLAGKNGAGKSTLIDYIMSPKKQYTGEILIEGVNIRDKHYHMMNRIGFTVIFFIAELLYIYRRSRPNHY